MAHIKFKHGEFTGHIGPVAFNKGHADTELPAMVAHFKREPDLFTVTEGDEQPEQPDEGKQGGDEGSDELPPVHTDLTVPTSEPRDGDGDGYVHDGTPDEQPAPGSDADPYDVNVAALRKLAGQRGLPQAGSKAELQERLRAHDAEQAEQADTDDTQE